MNETLIVWIVVSIIVVCFVCAFVKRPPIRFMVGLVLWIAASIGVLFVMGKIQRADQDAAQQSESQKFRNRMAQINGEEIPPGGVPEPGATPSPAGASAQPPRPILIPRSTPDPEAAAREIARKYGAAR